MARIRTIKPEFWTDEKIVQLPFEARLLFIGLWNFCDDDGYLIDEPDRIKMQILPSDDVDASACIDLLVACGLLDRLTLSDGRTALLVRHFADHQRVSHGTPSRIAPEVSGKLRIPSEERRKLAVKYGCEPGGSKEVACYSCGQAGLIWWPKLGSGRPGCWVAFSRLEIAHFDAEANGGATSCDNLVLCCRQCNRSMHTESPFSVVLRKIPENSGGLRPEQNRTEQNRVELNGKDQTGLRRSDRIPFDEGKAGPIASKLFSTLGYTGDDGGILWQVGALVAAGEISQHFAFDPAQGCQTTSPKNPVACYRKILRDHVGGADALKALLARVRIPHDFHKGPPATKTIPGNPLASRITRTERHEHDE